VPAQAVPVAQLVRVEQGVPTLVVLVVLVVLLARLVPAEYLGQMLVGVRVLRTPALEMLALQTRSWLAS
jgi:hypothetical protein